MAGSDGRQSWPWSQSAHHWQWCLRESLGHTTRLLHSEQEQTMEAKQKLKQSMKQKENEAFFRGK
jgi:hypothetical protein